MTFLGQHIYPHSNVMYPVWQHTFVSPSAFSRRAVVSYWRKYVHEVLVNRLGGLSLPRKSVFRLTDHPDMTLDVYRGRKTTMQQQQQSNVIFYIFTFQRILVCVHSKRVQQLKTRHQPMKNLMTSGFRVGRPQTSRSSPPHPHPPQ